MKNTSLYIIILFILFSCMTNDATFELREYYKSFLNKPLTKKELSFVNKLKEMGCDSVDIQPPTIGVDYQGGSLYSITIYSNFGQKKLNKDSLLLFEREIVYNLYDQVIEDSILFDMGNISVSIFVKNKNEIYQKQYNMWNKKYLEEDLGFKVIQNWEGKFVRIKVNKSDSEDM